MAFSCAVYKGTQILDAKSAAKTFAVYAVFCFYSFRKRIRHYENGRTLMEHKIP